MPSSSPDLEARRSRVSRIRRRVAGGAVALFALGTGAITLQLVTGHDPALAKAAAGVAATSRDRQHGFGGLRGPGYPGFDGGSDPSGSGAGGGSSSSDGASGSSGPSAGQVAPLTTGQS
jgi:hypothetical protein